MPKFIKHFDLPKKGQPTVDGEEFPFHVAADYPVETRTRQADGLTFVTLTLLAEKVTIGGELGDQIDAMGARLGAEEVERMRIVDGDGNVIRETVTEVE